MNRNLETPMTRSLVLAGALLFVATLAQAEDQAKVLDGEWTVVQFERAGKAPPKEALETLKVTIKDGVLDMRDSKRGEPATFTLNSKKSPAEIDLKFKEGPKNDIIREAVGIYELKDDQLKLAWRKDGTRPTEFKSIADNRSSELMVLKRKK
jgi:uncharacterized protein (TIGR03067 family)